ncbi:hypothetical protein BBP40_005561, partial [Aspergillus hancockii]
MPRRSLGVSLQGESSDHTWGVVGFVTETGFPDIRRRTAVHSSSGFVKVIPRERVATGEYLMRLYVQAPGAVAEGAETEQVNGDGRVRRGQVTLEGIFEQAQTVFLPYYVRSRYGEKVDWWTAYPIEQRVAETFEVRHSEGVGRVLIVGDSDFSCIRAWDGDTDTYGSLQHATRIAQ